MKTIKKIISMIMALLIIFSSLSVVASAASYEDIVSMEVYATKDLVENYSGYINQEWINDSEYEEYFFYNVWDCEPHFIINFTDGSSIEGNYDTVMNYLEYNVFESFGFSQSLENQWKAGNSYTVDFYFYSFTGNTVAQDSFEVNIVENPVKSVSVNEITLIENYDGSWAERYDSLTDSNEEFYYYNLPTLQYTVTLKDGTEIDSVDGGFEYNGNWYCINVDQYNAPLKSGRNEAAFSVLGYNGKVVINVEDTPIQNITIDEINLIENMNGGWNSFYNETTGEYEDYFYYNLPTLQYTVTLKDGTEIDSVDGGFEYNGNWYYINVEQYNNPLKPGRNEAAFSVLGYNGKVIVTVDKTPIQSITIKNVDTKTEYTDGYWSTHYNSITGEPEKYFNYNIDDMEYTVTFKDGTVLQSIGRRITYKEINYELEINQEKTPLKVGDNIVEYSLLGYEGTVKITVLPSPVKEVVVKDISLIENVNGYFTNKYNPDTENYEDVFIYSIPQLEFSILFNDGVIKASEYGSLYYNNEYYSIDVASQYSNPLKPGDNTMDFTVGGYRGTFTVTVKENPVQNVTVEPLFIVKNTNGGFVYNYDNYPVAAEEPAGEIAEEPATCAVEEATIPVEETTITTTAPDTTAPDTTAVYPTSAPPTTEATTRPSGGSGATNGQYGYYLHSKLFTYTVELKDGTVLQSDNGSILYGGKSYSIEVNGGDHNRLLDDGANTIDVSVLGFDTTATINIVDSPVKKITADTVRIPLSSGENYDYSYETKYDLSDEIFCDVEFNDGSQVRISLSVDQNSHTGGYKYLNTQYYLEAERQQMPLDVGMNTVTVSFMGKTVSVPVEVYDDISSPFRYDEVYGGVVITGYVGPDVSVLEVPSEINGLPVIGISYLGYTCVETLKIPDSVKHTAKGWLSVRELKNLYLGSGISEFDINEIDYCLKYIEVSPENETFFSIDGVLYSKDKTTVVAYPPAKGAVYKVPDFVSNIDIFYGSGMYNSLYRNVELEFSSEYSHFVTVDGVTYSADMKRVVWCNPEKTGNYIMPDSVEEIAAKAFEGSSLSSVSISPNVTEIVYATFANCRSLVSVELPQSVKSIGKQSFEYCSSLKSIDLSGVEYFGEHSFVCCSSLDNIVLSENLTESAGNVFAACSSLSEIVIPSSLRAIPSAMFVECTSLKNVTISEGVEIISQAAFERSGITSVELPESVRIVYPYAFADCDSLEEVVFDSAASVIPTKCFSGCGKLSKVIIGDNVTHIEEDAFEDCYNISEITLPENLLGIDTSLGETEYCKQVASRENGLAYIGDILIWADSAVSGKINVKNGTRIIANGTFYNNKNITEVTFPDSLRIIGDKAFSCCSLLEKADLPDGVEVIGLEAFYGTSIREVTIPSSVTDIVYRSYALTPVAQIDMPEKAVNLGGRNFENTVWYSGQQDGLVYIENVLYENKGFIASSTEIEVPDGIKSIAGHAFDNEVNLNSITLSDTVEIIGEHAFSGCLTLEAVNLSSALKIIDDGAFRNCAISEITLPEGLEVLGGNVFADTDITSIYIPASVRLMSQFTFMECAALEEINVDENNPYFSSIDGVLYNKDGTKVIFCPEGKKGVVTLSEKVSEAEKFAFNNSHAQMIVIKNPEFKADALVFNSSIESENGEPGVYTYLDYNCYDYSLIAYPWIECHVDVDFFNPVTICAPVGSDAHKYALAHDHPFEVYVPEDIHEHEYVETVITVKTCLVDGESIFSCECGDSYEKTFPATGHSFGEWVTETNTKTRICDVCGYIEKIVETDAGNVEIEAPEQPEADFEVEDIPDGDDRYILAESVVDDSDKILKVFDLTLKNNDGVHVQPNGTVKVKLPLDWTKDGSYKVYRVNDDGTLTDMNAVRQGSHMLFETDHFSIYVIVEVDGNTFDNDDNSQDNNGSCGHICHKDGFMGFLWKIIRFFCNLFKINPLCECGAAHY